VCFTSVEIWLLSDTLHVINFLITQTLLTANTYHECSGSKYCNCETQIPYSFPFINVIIRRDQATNYMVLLTVYEPREQMTALDKMTALKFLKIIRKGRQNLKGNVQKATSFRSWVSFWMNDPVSITPDRHQQRHWTTCCTNHLFKMEEATGSFFSTKTRDCVGKTSPKWTIFVSSGSLNLNAINETGVSKLRSSTWEIRRKQEHARDARAEHRHATEYCEGLSTVNTTQTFIVDADNKVTDVNATVRGNGRVLRHRPDDTSVNTAVHRLHD